MFCLAFLSFLYGAHRRQWQPLVFAAIWSASQLVPLLAVAGVLYSRYTLIGFFPLLIVPAWCLADLLPRCRVHLPRVGYASLAALAITFFLAWPTANAAWNAVDWRAPVLTRSDTLQYITRFSAGTSTEQAVAWFNADARKHPITVIAGDWIGLPNDLLYLTLQHDPNIQLLRGSYVDEPLRPAVGPPDTFALAADRWVDNHVRPITLDPSRPTYFLSPARRDPQSGEWSELIGLDKLPPGSRKISIFRNGPAAGAAGDFSELRLVEIALAPAAPSNSVARR